MQFQIDDMSCGACVRSIEKVLAALDPATIVEADLEKRQIRVESTASQAQIISALQEAGFPPKAV